MNLLGNANTDDKQSIVDIPMSLQYPICSVINSQNDLSPLSPPSHQTWSGPIPNLAQVKCPPSRFLHRHRRRSIFKKFFVDLDVVFFLLRASEGGFPVTTRTLHFLGRFFGGCFATATTFASSVLLFTCR